MRRYKKREVRISVKEMNDGGIPLQSLASAESLSSGVGHGVRQVFSQLFACFLMCILSTLDNIVDR